MAYSYDGASRKISIPRGDTANINLTVSGGGFRDGDYVIFRVRNIGKGDWAITKLSQIANGGAVIRIESEDTAGLSSGAKYGWTIGLVSDPDFDAQGNPSATDATDNVLTAFDKFMDFVVLETGVMGRG